MSRRQFLHLMGASLALAGLSGCTRQPHETIVPYVKQPEELVLGKPLFFATAVTLRGYAQRRARRESRGTADEGRGQSRPPRAASAPPTSSARRGCSTSTIPIACRRSDALDRIRPWSAFRDVAAGLDRRAALEQGRAPAHPHRDGHVADARSTDPRGAPAAPRGEMDPVRAGDAGRRSRGRPAGVRRAGRGAISLRATRGVILSIDADFVGSMPGSLRYARDFVAARRVEPDEGEMSRLYCVETSPTATGAKRGSSTRAQAERGRGVRARGRRGARARRRRRGCVAPEHAAWIEALVARSQEERGRKPGRSPARSSRPPSTLLAHAMNQALGNVGKTVVYTEPVEAAPQNQLEALRAARRRDGQGARRRAGDPRRQSRVHGARRPRVRRSASPRSACASTGRSTTTRPPSSATGTFRRRTPLETWSDARAYDGTVTILQPLIAPLYEGKSAHELLGHAVRRAGGSDELRPRARDLRRGQRQGGARALLATRAARRRRQGQRGRRQDRDPEARLDQSPAEGRRAASRTPSRSRSAPIRRSSTAAGSNNGWLQELPKPLTKLTWDNVAMIEPGARRSGSGLETEMRRRALDRRPQRRGAGVDPARPGRRLRDRPSRLRPDDAPGRVGTGAGFNAYQIRSSNAPLGGIRPRGPQDRRRHAARLHAVPADDGGAAPSCARPRSRSSARTPSSRRSSASRPAPDDTMYTPPWTYDGYAWGMAIDLIGLHRLQRLRRRLPGGEQHRRSSARTRSAAAARCTGSASTATTRASADTPADVRPAGAVHALRERALRGGLPGRRDGPQRGGLERHGVQPLRRHPLLLEQLPVQGAPVQLLPLLRLDDRELESCCATRTSRCAAAA